DECVFRPRCTGIFRVYLELHGEDEFRPVTRDELLALDPQHLNFVLLVAPRLAALRAALAAGENPSGWPIEQEVCEDRRRQVDMIFAHRDGRARLVFVAPGRGHAPVITCDAYDVDVDVDPGVPADALRGLFSWIHARLAAGSDGEFPPVLVPQAVEHAVRGSM